ncbi:MAG: DUF3786 domain-containing protein [Desulfamplus sp.]|nr:DUF3786 domain-containing protein [Desulfamplus sp.]MBF0389085.1 DUF3786 domain-containing protein [Desulfamplus sp.]
MEVFKLLNKSNCKECFKPTCLAFAGAVFKGEKELRECPYVSSDVVAKFGDAKQNSPSIDQGADEIIEGFRKSISNIDLASKAKSIGATFSDGRLNIKVMGKNVSVDTQGKIYTDIHANQWVVVPLLNYIVQGTDTPITGNWVPFRELPNGRAWQGLFHKQCEELIKKVADTYPNFFEQILELFNGKEVEKHYKSDISLVLHPLPKIPILICYWLAEDEIESDLNLFFDANTEEHLHINSIYALGAGFARMVEKLAMTHGF